MYESRSQGEVEALQSATDDSELTRLLKFNGCVSRQIASFRRHLRDVGRSDRPAEYMHAVAMNTLGWLFENQKLSSAQTSLLETAIEKILERERLSK